MVEGAMPTFSLKQVVHSAGAAFLSVSWGLLQQGVCEKGVKAERPSWQDARKFQALQHRPGNVLATCSSFTARTQHSVVFCNVFFNNGGTRTG